MQKKKIQNKIRDKSACLERDLSGTTKWKKKLNCKMNYNEKSCPENGTFINQF